MIESVLECATHMPVANSDTQIYVNALISKQCGIRYKVSFPGYFNHLIGFVGTAHNFSVKRLTEYTHCQNTIKNTIKNMSLRTYLSGDLRMLFDWAVLFWSD